MEVGTVGAASMVSVAVLGATAGVAEVVIPRAVMRRRGFSCIVIGWTWSRIDDEVERFCEGIILKRTGKESLTIAIIHSHL